MPKEFLTITQAAKRISCSRKTIERRVADGTFTRYNFGPRMVRLDAAEIDALLAPR